MLKKPFKLTSQRAIILGFVKENYTHPTVDGVFRHVKDRLPRISKKTVYSNLQFLCSKGLIQEVRIKGVLRYEPKQLPHPHTFCRKCGRIEDVKLSNLISELDKPAKKLKDFDVDFVSITFYGVCKKCKGGLENGRKE